MVGRHPLAEVYRLLADSSTWTDWSPIWRVTLIERAPDGGEGVGAVKETRLPVTTGRERIVALTPDRQLSYAYLKGIFSPYFHGYVGVVDLDDDGGGTSIHGHSTFTERSPESEWISHRSIVVFIYECADGLAAAAATDRVG